MLVLRILLFLAGVVWTGATIQIPACNKEICSRAGGTCWLDSCTCEHGWMGPTCTDVNVAYNKPASQCGTYVNVYGHSYPADLAVDGKFHPYQYAHPFCPGQQAWWIVDLLFTHVVKSVHIHKRISFHKRLRSFSIRGGFTSNIADHSQICERYDDDDKFIDLNAKCDQPMTVQYVSIKIEHNDNDKGVFAIIEVLIAGDPVGNIAYHKEATQCGTYTEAGIEYSANLALDGIPNPYMYEGSCAHPYCLGEHAWWSVDLTHLYIIFKVTLYNRESKRTQARFQHGDRLRNFVIRGGSSSNVADHSDICKRYSGNFPSMGKVICDPPMTARHVSIQIEHDGHEYDMFALCEVIVEGELVDFACDQDTCIHGDCVGAVESDSCVCETGWMGVNCDTVMNCYNNTCVNGRCIDRVDHYICFCDDGYEGEYCDDEILIDTAMQCGTYREAGVDYKATLAIDGNTLQEFNQGSCAHPFCQGQQAWWMLVLRFECVVSSVTIINRSTFASRLRDFIISGGSTSNIAEHSQICHRYPGTFPSVGTVTCTPPMTVQYVSIKIEHNGSDKYMFALCEVTVEATRV